MRQPKAKRVVRIGCWILGHEWRVIHDGRVCDYCGKFEPVRSKFV